MWLFLLPVLQLSFLSALWYSLILSLFAPSSLLPAFCEVTLGVETAKSGISLPPYSLFQLRPSSGFSATSSISTDSITCLSSGNLCLLSILEHCLLLFSTIFLQEMNHHGVGDHPIVDLLSMLLPPLAPAPGALPYILPLSSLFPAGHSFKGLNNAHSCAPW